MKETGYIRNIVKLICAFPLVLPVIASAMDNKGLEELKIYTPHELDKVETPIACARYDSNQLGSGKFTDLEAKTNLKLCGFKGTTIAGVPAAGDMLFRHETRNARKSRSLFDKSVDYYDRFKNAFTKEYDQPGQVEVPMDLYDELYNQNNGGRRSVKWRLMF